MKFKRRLSWLFYFAPALPACFVTPAERPASAFEEIGRSTPRAALLVEK